MPKPNALFLAPAALISLFVCASWDWLAITMARGEATRAPVACNNCVDGCTKEQCHDTGGGDIEILDADVDNGDCDPVSGETYCSKEANCQLDGTLQITNKSGFTLYYTENGAPGRTALNNDDSLIKIYTEEDFECKTDEDNEWKIEFFDAAFGGTLVAEWKWKCKKCPDNSAPSRP